MTVFDVGANVGPYALVAARRVGDRGSVHAFEPTPKSAAGLRRNVGLNGLTNVVVNEVAVSDTAGEVNLYLDEESAHLAGLSDFIGKPISLQSESAMAQEQYDIVLM